jgi:hypothetical protein
MTSTQKTAEDLKNMVSIWVDRSFNYIDLSNAEKVFDQMLIEHIESNQTEETAAEFINDYSYSDDFKDSGLESALEYVQEEHEGEFTEYAEQDHYPMWSTLFEFRSEPSQETINAAQEAGFGIINSSDHYNTMLFVKGAGYSFYSAHWIPMYLGLTWTRSEEYKDIDFSHV